MENEGKILGYNKKTVVTVIIAIILAGIIFYAGAEYEKNKLTSHGLLKGKGSNSSTSTGSKKNKQNIAPGTTMPSSNGMNNTNTPGNSTMNPPAGNAPAPATPSTSANPGSAANSAY